MTESKHTPGPWEWASDEVFTLEDNSSICVVLGRANGDANARLIAAAPDLLEAILNSDDAHWTPAMRAAIAKATK